MKIKFLNIGTLLLIVPFLLGTISCSNNDEPSGNGGVTSQIGKDVFTGKRLSKIIKNDGTGNDWYFDFVYENGLLVSCTEYYGGYVNDGYKYVLSYEGNEVTISRYSDITTFTLDENGFAISCTGKHNYTFEYNDDMQLVSYGNRRIDYNADGNATKCYSADYEIAKGWDHSFYYTDSINANGLLFYGGDLLTVYDQVYDDVDYFNDYDLLIVAYYAGILGKPMQKNVLLAINNESLNGSLTRYELTVEYYENGDVLSVDGSNGGESGTFEYIEL